MSVVGTVYLLHLTPPYKHARHYLGWTEGTPEERLRMHLDGRGSPLVRAAVAAGGIVSIVRLWEGRDRHFERRLKNGRNVPRLCPVCSDR